MNQPASQQRRSTFAKLSEQMSLQEKLPLAGDPYSLKPYETGGLVPTILRPSETIPLERQWIDLNALITRINKAASILDLDAKPKALRLLLCFANSLQWEGYKRFIYNVRYRQYAEWAEEVGCSLGTISKAFTVLVKKGILRVWRRDSQRKFYVITESFGEFLTGVTDELPAATEPDEFPHEETHSTVDKQPCEFPHEETLNFHSRKLGVSTGGNSEFPHEETHSYIENKYSINSYSEIIYQRSSNQCPQVDNSKLSPEAFDLANRFDARFNLPSEPLADIAAWFDDRLQNWELRELELFLKFANTQKPILTVIKGKTHPPRKKLFEQFMVWLNREMVIAGGVSC